MKTSHTIILLLILIVIFYFVYKKFSPPSFEVINVDNLNKKGTFKFGDSVSPFDLLLPKTIPAANGSNYSLSTIIKNNAVSFMLYKNGKSVKILQTVTF